MAAAKKNITIERDASLSLHYFMENTSDHSPFDLTGYTIQGQVRETPGSKHAIVDLTCAIVDPPGGEITIALTDTATAALKAGVYFWDLFVRHSGGQSIRLMAGHATVVDTCSR